MRYLRLLGVLLMALFSLGATLSGTSPLLIAHVVLASAVNWDPQVVPSWCRVATVKNDHASGILYWGATGESGAFDANADEYFVIPAGAALTLPLSAGVSAAPTAVLTIPLYSATASLPASVVCTASPE